VISKKATSAAAIATILMATIAFGFWLVTPSSVDAATYEENATTSNVTVLNYVACGAPVEFANGIEFGSLDPESDNNNNTDQEYTFHAPSTNNINIHYYIKANDNLKKDGSNEIILEGNYTWDDSLTSEGEVVDAQNLTTSYQSFSDGTDVAPDANVYLRLWLDVPLVTPGTYSNTVTIKCNGTS